MIRTKQPNIINTNPITSACSSGADDDHYQWDAAQWRWHVFYLHSEPGWKLLGVLGTAKGVIKLKADKVKTLLFDLSLASQLEETIPKSQQRLPGLKKKGRVTKVNKKLSSSVVTRAGGDPEAYKISQNISDMWSPLTRLNVFYCNFRRYLWGLVLSVWGSDVTTTKLEPEKNPSGDETRSKPTTLSSLSCSC